MGVFKIAPILSILADKSHRRVTGRTYGTVVMVMEDGLVFCTLIGFTSDLHICKEKGNDTKTRERSVPIPLHGKEA